MSIDRRRNLSLKEFLHDYMRVNRPVIIENATAQWSAMNTWTPAYLKQQYGDKEVVVDGNQYRLEEFIDLVESGSAESPSPYLSNLVIRKQFPELLPDVLPGLRYAFSNDFKDRWVRGVGYQTGPQNVEFYLGGQGSRFSTLHVDNFYMHAFITQVFGDKEFMLIAPDQSEFVYAGGDLPDTHSAKTMRLDTPVVYHSSVNDVFDPDYERFPLFRNVTPVTAVVGAPDTVFIPAGWWHATRMLSVSIAVSTNTLNSDNLSRVSRTYTFSPRHSRGRAALDHLARPFLGPITWASEAAACRSGRSAPDVVDGSGSA